MDTEDADEPGQDRSYRPKYLPASMDALIGKHNALREFESFYNEHRPHQGIANARPLRSLPAPITDSSKLTHLHIHGRDRLGGVLRE
jgi:hypothetical protein